jgi:hypothetical protein
MKNSPFGLRAALMLDIVDRNTPRRSGQRRHRIVFLSDGMPSSYALSAWLGNFVSGFPASMGSKSGFAKICVQRMAEAACVWLNVAFRIGL